MRIPQDSNVEVQEMQHSQTTSHQRLRQTGKRVRIRKQNKKKRNRHKDVSKCSLSFYNLLEIANVRSDVLPNHRLKVRTYPSIREENRAVVHTHYLNRPSKLLKKPGISYRKTLETFVSFQINFAILKTRVCNILLILQIFKSTVCRN